MKDGDKIKYLNKFRKFFWDVEAELYEFTATFIWIQVNRTRRWRSEWIPNGSVGTRWFYRTGSFTAAAKTEPLQVLPGGTSPSFSASWTSGLLVLLDPVFPGEELWGRSGHMWTSVFAQPGSHVGRQFFQYGRIPEGNFLKSFLL